MGEADLLALGLKVYASQLWEVMKGSIEAGLVTSKPLSVILISVTITS